MEFQLNFQERFGKYEWNLSREVYQQINERCVLPPLLLAKPTSTWCLKTLVSFFWKFSLFKLLFACTKWMSSSCSILEWKIKCLINKFVYVFVSGIIRDYPYPKYIEYCNVHRLIPLRSEPLLPHNNYYHVAFR